MCRYNSVYCRWVRPGPPYVPQQIVDFFRRLLGFVPLIMWGIWYSAVPYKVCTSAWVIPLMMLTTDASCNVQAAEFMLYSWLRAVIAQQ